MSDLAPLLWLDLETTGLDKTSDQIIELAACITEPVAPYKRLDSGMFATLVQPRTPFVVGDFVLAMHTKNGLWRDMLTEPTMPLDVVDRELERFIGRTVQGSKVTLAGSGVATFDFVLLNRDLPRTAKRLTYFTFDTGVIRRYRQSIGKLTQRESDGSSHRAQDDVREALAQLGQYAAQDVQPPPEPQRVALVCVACHHRIDIDEPMRCVQLEPARFQHVDCPHERTPAFDVEQGETT